MSHRKTTPVVSKAWVWLCTSIVVVGNFHIEPLYMVSCLSEVLGLCGAFHDPLRHMNAQPYAL